LKTSCPYPLQALLFAAIYSKVQTIWDNSWDIVTADPSIEVTRM